MNSLGPACTKIEMNHPTREHVSVECEGVLETHVTKQIAWKAYFLATKIRKNNFLNQNLIINI